MEMRCRELTWSRSYKNGICEVCKHCAENSAQCSLCATGVSYRAGLMGMKIRRRIFSSISGITLLTIIYKSVTNITVYIASALGAG